MLLRRRFPNSVIYSPQLATATASIYMPAISLSITVTNSAALITNNFCSTFTNGPSSLFVQRTFIYNAATMGTNFSTNFPAFWMTLTNNIYGQATQGAGNPNGATIQ